MTGCTAETVSFERSFDDMNTNPELNRLCTAHMEELGFENISRDTRFKASVDVGNVSYVVPAIHMYFDITNGVEMSQHSKEFAAATMTDYAREQMLKMAAALALTGYDYQSDLAVRERVGETFRESLKGL